MGPKLSDPPAIVAQVASYRAMSDTFERLKAALADRYAIEREIGAGGMATVYLAEDLKHRRKVAVKVLRPVALTITSSVSERVRELSGLCQNTLTPARSRDRLASLGL